MVSPVLKLRKDVWPLILLALDNFSPVRGLARLHLIFFIYHYVGYNYEPCLLGPYSPELEGALRNLIRAGLVKVILVREGKRRMRIYQLTEEGRRVAERLLSKLATANLELGGVLVIKGNEILKDLESIKKYYKDKPLSLLLRKCLKEIERDEPYHLRARLNEDIRAFVKDLAEELGLL